MADKGSVAPFVKSFQGKTEITSADFLKIFKKFDKDGEYFCNIAHHFAEQTVQGSSCEAVQQSNFYCIDFPFSIS